MKTYYYIPNVWDKDDLTVDNALEFNSDRDIRSVNGGYDKWEVDWLVGEMAEDYYDNHDGWEIANSWSGGYLKFVVWNDQKELIGKFEVLLEFQPTFTAHKLTDEKVEE